MLNNRYKLGKPLKIILMLVVLLVLSMMGAALAAYAKDVTLFSTGWVGPKYYAFEVENELKRQSLAPEERAVYTFTVKNYNDGGTAQVPLKVAILVTCPVDLAQTGKVFAELTYDNSVLGSSDKGKIECSGREMAANVKQSDRYTLTLTWLDADTALLGTMTSAVFEPSNINIRVSGYQ